MTELEKSQKRQLDAAQKLIESYDKQVKDLKAKLALSDSANVYRSKYFWLIDDDSLELYELNLTTKQLKRTSSYTIKSLA